MRMAIRMVAESNRREYAGYGFGTLPPSEPGYQTFQKLAHRFIVRILRDEFAADGEVEDGLAELLDVFGARGEAREMMEVKAGVLAELVGIRAVVQSMQGRRRQLIPPALPLRLRRLQPITQRHQFIHFGDDAVLFGERWNATGKARQVYLLAPLREPPCPTDISQLRLRRLEERT